MTKVSPKIFRLLIVIILTSMCYYLKAQSEKESFQIITNIFNHDSLQNELYFQKIGLDSVVVIFQGEEIFKKTKEGEYRTDRDTKIVYLTEPWLFYYDVQYFFVIDSAFYEKDEAQVIFHSTSRYKYSEDINYVQCKATLIKKDQDWVLEKINIEKGNCCNW